jgi:hypothetical protein
MGTRTITMSHAELDRFGVITRVQERRLTQEEAARTLGLGVRHVQRLCAASAAMVPTASCRASAAGRHRQACPHPREPSSRTACCAMRNALY